MARVSWKTPGPERLITPATGGRILTAAAIDAVPPIDAPMSTNLLAPSDRRNAAAATTASSSAAFESVDAPVPGKSKASTRYPRCASSLPYCSHWHRSPSDWWESTTPVRPVPKTSPPRSWPKCAWRPPLALDGQPTPATGLAGALLAAVDGVLAGVIGGLLVGV